MRPVLEPRSCGFEFGFRNWRHGDIKPENVLCFTRGKKDAMVQPPNLADDIHEKAHGKYRLFDLVDGLCCLETALWWAIRLPVYS